MVLLNTTSRILSAISSLPSSDRSSLSNLPTTIDAPIEHKTLLAISRCSRQFTLNALLHGTHVYIAPPLRKSEPSPQYVALMARLRKEQEKREYAALVSRRAVEQADVEADGGKDDISPSLVLNILLSVVMCAATMLYLTRWWHNDGVRVLVSLGTGLVVGIAEVTVYAAYLRNVRVSIERERAKHEKKQFITEFRGDEPGIPLDHILDEKEEIWGRGKHGGMRRRVREKWEREQNKNDH
ncbi:uncharacterized protein A1O9_00302 [Exophiala aquamarina CBS 119918]|uniref:Uncharacterized protein n=1 Tax=Exophiala aquamarina CBS 119918 TaxID=1182545 RepID=A0A072Q369_9EURO|nr:uncharacterized protein A1O9_00302 [Exophiala aquamarina CBS 119918]KEF62330.1 hypothetical protein A1O9_00302 [Exophiala aquamarina CBS 119918]